MLIGCKSNFIFLVVQIILLEVIKNCFVMGESNGTQMKLMQRNAENYGFSFFS